LADLQGDADWCDAEHEQAASLALVSRPAPEHDGKDTAEYVGAQWAEIALMEHASIAAFARFTLQLMHLGAPRGLVELSQRAMWDETSHAKACFALAARYLGSPVGPGRLPMDAALQDIELGQIVLTAFREGCVGETVATLEAREACDAATDPWVRRVLAQIAIDELRHSELAWQFVRWALDRGGASLQRELAAEVARLTSEASRVPSRADSPGAPDHGILSARAKAQVRRRALTDVVLPCARQLLADRARAATPNAFVAATV